jgi:hypothetical protein
LVADLSFWILLAGLALALPAALLLALALGRERARRRAAEAALAAHRETAALSAEQLALLDRRRAAIQPLDALAAAWTRSCRPAQALVAAAGAALDEAHSVFPRALAPELDEAAALLLCYRRHQDEAEAAIGDGRRSTREEMLEREIALESALKPKLAGLRRRLADAARLPEGQGP